jgi:survival of motor neuron protein-interacting protein 1
LKDEQGWIKFCFGEESVPEPQDPLLSHLIQFDEVSILRMLKYHIKWIKNTEWTTRRLSWMFALLVCLDLPIEASMQAELWQLRTQCVRSRADESLQQEELIAGLNVLITVLERQFGQREC